MELLMNPRYLCSLTVLSLNGFLSIAGMERPDHNAHLTTPEKVRVQLYRAVHRAIEGEDIPL